jgi:hypothetical protein
MGPSVKVARRLLLGACFPAAVAAVAVSSAAGAAPVAGSVAGPVTAVKGQTFKLTTSLSPTGSSTVSIGSATTITEQVAGARDDVRTGACVTAIGAKGAKGIVTALRVTITQPVKGQCSGGFGRPGGNGTRPRGTRPPGTGTGTRRPPGANGNGFANFGFAFGKVTAVKGATVTVKGQAGSTSVTLTKTSQFSKTEDVAASAVAVKLCAFVQGTSPDKGVTVKAQQIRLTEPGTRGCGGGFGGP